MLDETSDTNFSCSDVINKITLGKLDIHNHKQELIELIEDKIYTFEVAIAWIQFINTDGNVPYWWDTNTETLDTKLTKITNEAAEKIKKDAAAKAAAAAAEKAAAPAAPAAGNAAADKDHIMTPAEWSAFWDDVASRPFDRHYQ